MLDLDPYLKMALGLGCTKDQLENFLKAGITLQYKRLKVSKSQSLTVSRSPNPRHALNSKY